MEKKRRRGEEKSSIIFFIIRLSINSSSLILYYYYIYSIVLIIYIFVVVVPYLLLLLLLFRFYITDDNNILLQQCVIPPPFLSLSTATQKSTPSSHIRRDFLVEWLGATAVLVHCPLENIYYTDHRQLSSLLCAPTLRLEGARGTTSASSDWSCLHFLLQVPCLPFMSAFCCICLFVMSWSLFLS